MVTDLRRAFIGLFVAGGALSVACGGTSHGAGSDDGGVRNAEREASTPPSPEHDGASPTPRDAGTPAPKRDAGLRPVTDAARARFDAAEPSPSADASNGD